MEDWIIPRRNLLLWRLWFRSSTVDLRQYRSTKISVTDYHVHS